MVYTICGGKQFKIGQDFGKYSDILGFVGKKVGDVCFKSLLAGKSAGDCEYFILIYKGRSNCANTYLILMNMATMFI